MSTVQSAVLVLGIILTILTLTRAPAVIAGRNVRMFVAHALITACVLLTVRPIYLWVDEMLGGWNIANLISHLFFPLIFVFGGLQVARGLDRSDLAYKVAGPPGLMIAGASMLGILCTFIAAGPMPTSMGLDDYRDEPWVIAYKVVSYIYCAWVGAWLSQALMVSACSFPMARHQKVAQWLLGFGMLGVSLLPTVHLLEFWIPHLARPVADGLVYGSIILVATGPAIAFVSRSLRHLKEGRSGRRGPTSPPAGHQSPERLYERVNGPSPTP